MAGVARYTAQRAAWRSCKRLLQTVHLWMGLLLALPIIVIGLSGSALLLQREILAYSVPGASTEGEHAKLAEVIASAQSVAPENATARSVVPPQFSGAPMTVNFDAGGRPPRTLVHVDPVSLDVLGTAPIVNRGPILDFLIQAHAFLMLPAWIGFPIVGWMAAAMTFMAVSGIVLWWPRKGTWRHAFWIRSGARGLRFHIEFHHVMGFWGSLILFAMGVSGLYLVFPETFRTSVEAVLPTEQYFGSSDRTYAPGQVPLDADGAIKAALTAVPNTRVTNVQLPPNADLPFVVHLETTEFGPKLPAILVTLNARTGEINFIDDPRTYSLGDRFLNLQHALHFGIGLGWIWKVLVFVSGILPLALAITGLVMWWKRRAVRAPVPQAVFSTAAE
jgi:uncharacterized iron-regulated membrane protein